MVWGRWLALPASHRSVVSPGTGLQQKRSHSVACPLSLSRRRLWQHVTHSLKEGNIDAATEHKHRLEERQRAEERQRVALTTPWKPKYFAKEVLPLPHLKGARACFCIREVAGANGFVCGFYQGLGLLYTTGGFKFHLCQSLALQEEQRIFPCPYCKLVHFPSVRFILTLIFGT